MAKRRPAGDGMVRKRDDGRWEGRIVIGHKENGEPLFRHVYAKTQKALLDKLHQNIECYRDVELTEDSRMTLGEWLDRWLTEYKAGTVRPGTLKSYRCYIEYYIKPQLGDNRNLYTGLHFRWGYKLVCSIILPLFNHPPFQDTRTSSRPVAPLPFSTGHHLQITLMSVPQRGPKQVPYRCEAV